MHHAITFAYKYVTRCAGDEVHFIHVEPMAEACSPPMHSPAYLGNSNAPCWQRMCNCKPVYRRSVASLRPLEGLVSKLLIANLMAQVYLVCVQIQKAMSDRAPWPPAGAGEDEEPDAKRMHVSCFLQ